MLAGLELQSYIKKSEGKDIFTITSCDIKIYIKHYIYLSNFLFSLLNI